MCLMNHITADKVKPFYEEVGAKYPEEQIVYRELRGILRRKFILEHLGKAKGFLLDVGCNAGLYLRHYRGGPAVGVDISYNVLRRAKWKIAQSATTQNRYFIVGDAENLSFLKPGCFDFVLCSEVLEHVFHPEMVVAGIFQVLRLGGKALITTPNYRKQRPTWIDLGELRNYGITGGQYLHTAYRPEELEKMAKQVGLTPVESGTLEWEVKYATRLPVVILLLLRQLNKWTFSSSRFDHWNQCFFNWGSKTIYHICHFLQLEKLWQKFIKEGVRSYIIVRKE